MADARPGALVHDYDAVDIVVGFARALQASGAHVAPDRVHCALRALSMLDVSSRHDVYWVGRLTLCGKFSDIECYDRMFAAYFVSGERAVPAQPRRRPVAAIMRLVGGDGEGAADDEQEPADGSSERLALPSAAEVLRNRDIASMSECEREQLRLLLARLSLTGEARRSRRLRPAHRGLVDGHRTAEAWLRSGGEPARLLYERPILRPRRVVLLVDVSGSMDLYADALMRFVHGVVQQAAAPAEVFAMGTRLTRLTTEMGVADPDAAMTAAWRLLDDAGGGTRLGASLKEFLDSWGRRGLARGAVAVVFSDGWEPGDPALLGDQVARLHRLAHRVIWANPRKAAPGFAPTAAGMAAALPHVDCFVEGHSLSALEHLADVVLGRDCVKVGRRA